MKTKITHTIKQIKTQAFSYGKFVVENYGTTTKDKRIAAINKFLETTRDTTDKKVKNT
jgi:hypothetical protein